MKTIEVVAAIIMDDNRILCVQRNASKYDYISYKYEFPGGKVETDETKEQALVREIAEELNLNILVEEYFMTVDHSYPDFNIKMHSFICRSLNQDLKLNEHVDYKWLTRDELNNLDWAAADVPIVDKLIASL